MSPLQGIRVIDLTRYVAGPLAAQLLADLGADVVKVEALPTGDASRQSGPFVEDESVYFMASNRNKRSIAVDLRTADGKDVLTRLLSTADVFIENFRPSTAAAMGLDQESLRAINPRLVHVSISGFGNGAVGATLPGFDQTVQAMSGLMSVTGSDETGPLRVGIPVADTSTGVLAAVGALAALQQRVSTGEGSYVEASLLGSMLTMMSYQAQTVLSTGVVPGRNGNDHPILFPQGTFRAGDSAIAIASGNERMWRVLCDVLGLSHLAEEPRYADNAGRLAHRRELRAVIEQALLARPALEWIEAINAAGIPCGPVYDLEQALAQPTAHELGMVEDVVHSSIGPMKVLGTPLRVNGGDPDWLRYAPPRLGEHSRVLLAEAGMDDDEVERLFSSGVIREPVDPAQRRIAVTAGVAEPG